MLSVLLFTVADISERRLCCGTKFLDNLIWTKWPIISNMINQHPLYETPFGKLHNTTVERFLDTESDALLGKINLIFTSPPFPLITDKEYGNKRGSEYLDWLVAIFTRLSKLLSDDGSLVVEIGNTWNPSEPSMSLWTLRTLIAIAEQCDLKLCQQFVWENPNRLPGPAAWVTKSRLRLKDSHTHVWWFSKSPHPKVYQERILKPYSEAMNRLFKNGKYNHGTRPSEHVISEKSFLREYSGSIPGSTFILGNAQNSNEYISWCNQCNVCIHPARMPQRLATFFVNFLTDVNDTILDPFAGSNTSGHAAELLKRKWIGTECCLDYAIGSYGRFMKSSVISDRLLSEASNLERKAKVISERYLSGRQVTNYVQSELLLTGVHVTRPTINRMIGSYNFDPSQVVKEEAMNFDNCRQRPTKKAVSVHESLRKKGYSVSLNYVKSILQSDDKN